MVFGNDEAERKIIELISVLTGKESAQQIHIMINNAKSPNQGVTAEIISFIFLIIGASGIFTQIQVGLKTIFSGELKAEQTILQFIKDKFFSFALILGVAFLLLVSLMLNLMLTFFSNYIAHFFSISLLFSWIFNLVFSLVVTFLLFALLYKFLSDAHLKWSEVFFGSIVATILFNIGKFALGIYLGSQHVSNAYGPAGALIIILIWLYISAQILFTSAELIKIIKLHKSET